LRYKKTFFFSYSVIKVDEFTKKLWDIYETIRREGITQVCVLHKNIDMYVNTHKVNSLFTQFTANSIYNV